MKRSLPWVLLLFAVPLSAQNNGNRQVAAFSDTSKPGTVSVSMTTGSLTIRAYEGREVVIESAGGIGAPRVIAPPISTPPPEARGLRRIDSNHPASVAALADNTISIQSRVGSSDLIVQVPMMTNLRVSTGILRIAGSQAKVTIEGVEGEIEVSGASDIVLSEVAGSVVVNSSEGKITATLRKINPMKPMSLVSNSGSIDVTLPAETKANIVARTLDGGIYTGFDPVEFVLGPVPVNTFEWKPFPGSAEVPRTGQLFRGTFTDPTTQSQTTTPLVQESLQNALENLTKRQSKILTSPFSLSFMGSDRSAAGKLNGGGADFELRTLHGDIYIRKRK